MIHILTIFNVLEWEKLFNFLTDKNNDRNIKILDGIEKTSNIETSYFHL